MTIESTVNQKRLSITAGDQLKQLEFEEQILTQFEEQIGNFKKDTTANLGKIRDGFIIFDLSKCYWHDLGALLWLISLLYRLRKQGNELQLILPKPTDDKGISVWSFLIRWRFFETLSTCVDDPVNLLRPDQISYINEPSKYTMPSGIDEYGNRAILHSLRILEITTFRSVAEETQSNNTVEHFLNKYNDKIIISALSKFCGWELSSTKFFVQRVIREGFLNSFLQSEGTFSNISMKLDNKNLTLAICDNGIGIPEVLRNAFKRNNIRRELLDGSDVDLIRYFTEPDLVLDSHLIKHSTKKGTSSQPDRKGLGLYYLKSLVLNQGGELRIRSGRACVDFTKSNEPAEYDNMLDSPGTMLRIRTPLRQ